MKHRQICKSRYFEILSETDEQMQVQVKNWWYFIRRWQKTRDSLSRFGTG